MSRELETDGKVKIQGVEVVKVDELVNHPKQQSVHETGAAGGDDCLG